jgi:nitrogen fixation NifU-like protein
VLSFFRSHPQVEVYFPARHTPAMYSAAVLDHFQNPRNAGKLESATATVSVENPVCGDILELSARLEAGRIAEARFRTRGCVTAMACSSLLTELLRGKTLGEARGITAEQISQALGGLPQATLHGAQLARDAVDALLAKLA